MNIGVRQAAAAQRLEVVDCDIHPVYRTPAELHPFMSQRWREHIHQLAEVALRGAALPVMRQ